MVTAFEVWLSVEQQQQRRQQQQQVRSTQRWWQWQQGPQSSEQAAAKAIAAVGLLPQLLHVLGPVVMSVTRQAGNGYILQNSYCCLVFEVMKVGEHAWLWSADCFDFTCACVDPITGSGCKVFKSCKKHVMMHNMGLTWRESSYALHCDMALADSRSCCLLFLHAAGPAAVAAAIRQQPALSAASLEAALRAAAHMKDRDYSRSRGPTLLAHIALVTATALSQLAAPAGTAAAAAAAAGTSAARGAPTGAVCSDQQKLVLLLCSCMKSLQLADRQSKQLRSDAVIQRFLHAAAMLGSSGKGVAAWVGQQIQATGELSGCDSSSQYDQDGGSSKSSTQKGSSSSSCASGKAMPEAAALAALAARAVRFTGEVLPDVLQLQQAADLVVVAQEIMREAAAATNVLCQLVQQQQQLGQRSGSSPTTDDESLAQLQQLWKTVLVDCDMQQSVAQLLGRPDGREVAALDSEALQQLGEQQVAVGDAVCAEVPLRQLCSNPACVALCKGSEACVVSNNCSRCKIIRWACGWVDIVWLDWQVAAVVPPRTRQQ
jgi:hypothetical protein